MAKTKQPSETKLPRGRPKTGHTPKRYFRMDDEGWAEIERAAAADELSVSEFIREVLLRAAKRR